MESTEQRGVTMNNEQNKKESWREFLEALTALVCGLPGLALSALSLWSYSSLGDDCEWGQHTMFGSMHILAAMVGAVLFFIGLAVGVCIFRRVWRVAHVNRE
jgi:hypothetical protein